ncbi:MAG: ABC transporter ATP-binding protein [Deltaproteobacteria bacterium]|nr:ABC transporter ATP-binding protein [Deltaproteobacteria bacterium]
MIIIKDLKKSFRGKRVLDGVNLTIEEGKITFIIGRSGEGKSVLIKHLIGLIKPDSGQILLDGKDLVTMNERDLNEARRKFGMLFQGAALFDSMTVGENVAFPLREHTDFDDSKIMEIVKSKLARVGLPNIEHMMPSDLSGGMKKRVGLARAIAMDPSIVIFDEPTTGLDPIMSDSIGSLMLETQHALKTTYVAISHDIPLTYKAADMVAMLHEGRIIATGTVEEMKASDSPIIRQFLEGRAEGPIKVF